MNARFGKKFSLSCKQTAVSLAVVLAFSLPSVGLAQQKLSDFQEIHRGELPIILESPHGGMKDIPSIRPIPKLGGYDKFTLELTRLIRERMIERTGKSPEMIAMLANRSFIDVNRPAGPKAYTQIFTKQLYEAHYKEIDAALFRVKKRHGTGLMVLIHSGWNYPVEIAIGVNHKANLSTIPLFVRRHGWNTFHGPVGIGGRLFKLGYQVPGFGDTPPGNDRAGIPIMTRCRRNENIGIDGLEFEFQGSTLLADVKKRQELAIHVADTLLDFVDEYYTKIEFTDADDGNRVEPETAKWRTWTTSNGKYNVEAKLVKFAAGSVTLEKKDGEIVVVKLSVLSKDDQEFLRRRRPTTRSRRR